MSRPPKSKTAEWRRFLTKEEAAQLDALDKQLAKLKREHVELSAERRRLVALGMNRWQYEKRKG